MKFLGNNLCSLVAAVALLCTFLSGGCENPSERGSAAGSARMQTSCKNHDENACRASKVCTFDPSKNTCSDADSSVNNTCKAYQAQNACDADASCDWDNASSKCSDKVLLSTIYKWQAINFKQVPTHFVMSENGDAYAVSNGDLFYKDADGEFVQVAELKARPSSVDNEVNPPAEVEIELGNDFEIKPTKNGAVFRQENILLLVKDGRAVWGVGTEQHGKEQGEDDDEGVVGLRKNNISFFDVVNLKDEQVVLFGQDGVVGKLFYHNTMRDFADSWKELATKELDGEGDKQLDNGWIVAGNSHNGTLLLGCPKGVFESESIDDNGVVVSGPKLFPAEALQNITFFFVAGLDNEETTYLVSTISDEDDDDKNLLAYHVGAQEPRGNPGFSFKGKKIRGLTKWKNNLVLKTDQGLLGINNDGTENSDHDFKFATIRDDRSEMMQDESEVNLGAAADRNVWDIYNHGHTTWLFIKNSGVYKRVQTTGNPRT